MTRKVFAQSFGVHIRQAERGSRKVRFPWKTKEQIIRPLVLFEKDKRFYFTVINMMEIKGKAATAVCYAKVIEDEAVEQIKRMCDFGFTEGAKVRIMPDVHSGKGCTIGTTMTVIDKAVPNVVGVDIGCGMYTVKLKDKDIDFARRGQNHVKDCRKGKLKS